MHLTQGEEKHLLILMSICDLGGEGTKSAVLANIHDREYMVLVDTDWAHLPTRREARWHNDLAFHRDHLVKMGHIENRRRNSWEITDFGREYYHVLSERVALSKQFRWLSHQAVSQAIDSL